MKLDDVVFDCPGICLDEVRDAIEKLPENPYREGYLFLARPFSGTNPKLQLKPIGVMLLPHIERKFSGEICSPNGAREVSADPRGGISFAYGEYAYKVYRTNDAVKDGTNFYRGFISEIKKSREEVE